MPKYIVSDEDQTKRLDVFLVDKLPTLSRSSIQKLSKQGHISVNGSSAKISYRLRANDQIDVDYSQQTDAEIPDIEIEVLYEDDDCLVINKPIGVLTHSKGSFNPEATVATWLSRRINPEGKRLAYENAREGIVHRLDRATSGVLVCAKTDEAMSWLQKQFSERKAKKVYYAVISGELDPQKAIIDLPIERNPKLPQTFRVGANGKPSVTGYEQLRSNGKFSLIRLTPTTGRTHQLRVHLAYLDHPIVGDLLYGGEKSAERLYLHAESLEITLPNKKRQTFTAELPKTFTDLVA